MSKIPFAVLQLSGCAGCEVSLLNAGDWIDRYQLVYMPLVISAYGMPEVEVLLVSGGVRNEDDRYNLQQAARRAGKIISVGTCAISGGLPSLGDREEVRRLFLSETGRRHIPGLLPKCRPIDDFIPIDLYLPGCPPTPELFLATLFYPLDFKAGRIVCQECGRTKLKDMRPKTLTGFQRGRVIPEICLINQGYLCIGSSTRGGCRAPCPKAGHPCVGCRGPSNMLIEEESKIWFASIKRVFKTLTDINEQEIDTALRSAQYSLFLFQFFDYSAPGRTPRPKEKVL